MAAIKDCPKCGLVNPPTADRCDCGFAFINLDDESLRQQNEARNRKLLMLSVLATLGGLAGFVLFLVSGRLNKWLMGIGIAGLFSTVKYYYSWKQFRPKPSNAPPLLR